MSWLLHNKANEAIETLDDESFLDEYGRHDAVLADIAKRKQNTEKAQPFRTPIVKPVSPVREDGLSPPATLVDSLNTSAATLVDSLDPSVWQCKLNPQWKLIDINGESVCELIVVGCARNLLRST